MKSFEIGKRVSPADRRSIAYDILFITLEGTLSEGIRSHGLRRTRYRGRRMFYAWGS